MEIETKLREIFGDVLELDDPSVINDDTDFFALGGNSLTAMIVMEQVKEEFNCELDFTQVYEGAKFSDFVKMIEQVSDSTEGNTDKEASNEQ